MVTDKSRKHLPPYVSYRTFLNFLSGLQQQMPSRIDRSFWGDMLSGSTGIQLMSALRFLGLIDAGGKPTSRLKLLAPATGEQKARLLREIIAESFGFILQSQLDLESATYAQLSEVFHNTFQLGDDVARKCIKFFISIASDAGVPLSPFITKRARGIHTTSGIKSPSKKSVIRTNRNLRVPDDTEMPEAMWHSWPGILLSKFPTFDPTWNDEVKLKWFAAFDELLKRGFPALER